MADNVTVNSVPVATRAVTYSGDAAQNMQAVCLATVAGADDAKAATDVDSTNPLPAYQPDVSASGSITAADAVGTAPAGIGGATWTPTAGSYLALALVGSSVVHVAINNASTSQWVFDVSLDSTNGVDGVWFPCFVRQEGGTFGSAVLNFTGGGLLIAPVSGAKYFRARNTSFSSAPTVVIRAGRSSTPTPQIAGDAAHGATNGGNPLQLGMEAIAHGTNPTAVTAGQRTKNYANRAGVPFVMGGHPNIKTVRLQFTAAQTDVAIVTVASGLKIVVTALQVTLDNASTVFPSVRIGFGTVNTPTTTGVIAAHGGVPAGGGFSRGDGSGIIGIGADDEDLRITTVGAATGNGMEVVVTYYTVES